MHTPLLTLLRASLIAVVVSAAASAPAFAAEATKVLYHMVDGLDQAARGLGNIRNHLRAEPDTRIVVVAHGEGITFLLEGAKDRNGKPFDAAVAALATQGVEFLVCNNTLEARHIPASKLVLEARVVPAGVVEVANLQSKQHYAYLRP